jgi:hypothetical protein
MIKADVMDLDALLDLFQMTALLESSSSTHS